ncbi:MAG: hypothetical protein DRP76_04510, partial [Candidatus Omnitrophota bacterium]
SKDFKIDLPSAVDSLKKDEKGNLLKEEEKKEPIKKEDIFLSTESKISKWINEKKEAIEKNLVIRDPQYKDMREEAMAWFTENNVEVLIPVVMEDKVNALVGIGKKENLQAYTLRDIELLEKIGRQIGVTIDNALHHEDIIEKERLAQELKLGSEIQMSLLPQESPIIKGLNVAGVLTPAKEIGGDYFDFLPKGEDRLGIVIGDVSGKGVGAGLIMAIAKTAIHAISQEETSTKEIIRRTNQTLYQLMRGEKFMTMLYLDWDRSNNIMRYTSAGHEHILIYRFKNSKVEVIKSGGFMLGILDNIQHLLAEKEIKLNTQDKILLYTDGVTDAMNAKGERFGLDRLIKVLKDNGEKDIHTIIKSVKEKISDFVGTNAQYDDITLVAIEVK